MSGAVPGIWRRDITTTGHAEDIAAQLAPVDPGAANPYFSETAQELLTGMITAFQQNAPGLWTLRDLVLAARDSQRVKAIVASCKYTSDLLAHFRVDSTAENVCSNLATKLGKFSSIAASWHQAERKFSTSDWINEQRLVVLGNSPKAKKTIRTINQLLFTSLSKAILDLPGTSKAKPLVLSRRGA